jgi:hypothetical protein
MRLNLHFTCDPMRTQGHTGTIKVSGKTVPVIVTMTDENSIYSYFKHPTKGNVWCKGDIRGLEFYL